MKKHYLYLHLLNLLSQLTINGNAPFSWHTDVYHTLLYGFRDILIFKFKFSTCAVIYMIMKAAHLYVYMYYVYSLPTYSSKEHGGNDVIVSIFIRKVQHKWMQAKNVYQWQVEVGVINFRKQEFLTIFIDEFIIMYVNICDFMDKKTSF